VTPNPDRELAEARACIDRGEESRALQHLDRARRGYLKRHDIPGLEHLLVLADVLDTADERTRSGRGNLVYAIQQNVRTETRRAAQLRGEPWRDPYPALGAPTEHTRISLTRGVKIAIGIGVALTAAAIIAFFAAPAFVDVKEQPSPVTLRLVNDTEQGVLVGKCVDPACAVSLNPKHLRPGGALQIMEQSDDRMDRLTVIRPGKEAVCVPLRVHAAYKLAGSDSSVVLVAKLSQGTACPGTPLVPRPAAQTGL
jgi:hypothetical protein